VGWSAITALRDTYVPIILIAGGLFFLFLALVNAVIGKVGVFAKRQVSTQQPDVYSPYEAGLRELLGRIGQDHPGHSEALVYQQRLIENITRCRRYGDNDMHRAERAAIIDQLNKLTLSVLGMSFSELCNLPVPVVVEQLPERSRWRKWVGIGIIGGLLVLFGALLYVVPGPPPELTPIVASPNGATPIPTSNLTPIPTSPPEPTPTAALVIPEGQEWKSVRSFPSPGADPSGIVRVADILWVAVPCDDKVYGLNLEGGIEAEIEMPKPGCGPHEVGLAWDGKSLWGAWWDTVIQFDPDTGQALAEFEVDLDVVAITWDGSTLWMIDDDGNLAQYDRSGQRLRRLAVAVEGPPTSLTWVGRELWVADLYGELTRFDREFTKIGVLILSQCTAGTFPYNLHIYWDGESLWVADAGQYRILQCVLVD